MKKLRFEMTLMTALMATQKKQKMVRSIVTWCGHYFEKA
jgi:hypothetical protein